MPGLVSSALTALCLFTYTSIPTLSKGASSASGFHSVSEGGGWVFKLADIKLIYVCVVLVCTFTPIQFSDLRLLNSIYHKIFDSSQFFISAMFVPVLSIARHFMQDIEINYEYSFL